MAQCPRCKERGKPENFMSDPKCAFESGAFDTDNWQCETMNELRNIVETHAWTDDTSAGVLTYESDEGASGFVYLQWYKSRGRTDRAVMFNVIETAPPQPLTIEVAERIIASSVKKNKIDITQHEQRKMHHLQKAD